MSDAGVRCMWMRGGTSKGGYFLASDLPTEPAERDAFLLRVMGSPDPRQIDGMGGASPLTSKVAIVSPGQEDHVDLEYLFLQVFVEEARVSDAQTCGNILAGVGPFAIERGLVCANPHETPVVIRNTNTGQVVRAVVPTPNGQPTYAGSQAIDGVPRTAAPQSLYFQDVAGSQCGALLPTGEAVTRIEGLDVTLIDGGMPTIILDARELGLTGAEAPAALDANSELRARLNSIRLAAGSLMNLGDVRESTVPKVTLVSPARSGGMISTRCFIPHRCHEALGVLCGISIAHACLLPSGPAAEVASVPEGVTALAEIEHPSGGLGLTLRRDDAGTLIEAGTIRTARKLFDGFVFA